MEREYNGRHYNPHRGKYLISGNLWRCVVVWVGGGGGRVGLFIFVFVFLVCGGVEDVSVWGC